MDIVVYLRMLRRHWKLVAALTVAGACVGAASSLATGSGPTHTRRYFKATHTLFLDASSIDSQVRPIYTNLDQIAVLATTGDVPRRVATELGGDARELVTHVFTLTNSTTNTLDIVCAEESAADAVECADAFADELIKSLEEREAARFNSQRDEVFRRLDSIQRDMTALDAQIATRPPNVDLLQAQRDSFFNQYRLNYEQLQQLAQQGGPVSVVSTLEHAESEPITAAEYNDRIALGRLGQNRARADFESDGDPLAGSTEVSGPRFDGPVSRGSLGALLGLMLGLGLAVVADRVDRRLRTRDEVEAAFGMPVLAEIPLLSSAQQRTPGVLSATTPLSRTAEAYRAVRSSLMFQQATDPRARTGDALVVLVGSAGPREGKTTTSANLATLFAETGRRVLAINCDFRRPSLHEFFDLPNEPRRVLATKVPGLWVVTDVTTGTSSSNPAFVVEEQRRLVASARSRFDVIILDTAPMLTTNDATEVMRSADLAVIVCRAGVTTSDSAQRVRELLSRIAAPVSGVTLLGTEAATNDYYYYYSRDRLEAKAETFPGAAERDAPWRNGTTNGNGAHGPVTDTGAVLHRAQDPELRPNV